MNKLHVLVGVGAVALVLLFVFSLRQLVRMEVAQQVQAQALLERFK